MIIVTMEVLVNILLLLLLMLLLLLLLLVIFMPNNDLITAIIFGFGIIVMSTF